MTQDTKIKEVGHTAGAWFANGREIHATASGNLMVAQCIRSFGSAAEISDAEAEANARLIAAAPDLLAAVKDAMRSARKDFKHGPDGDRQHREAYAEQFAAIRKAEGRAS